MKLVVQPITDDYQSYIDQGADAFLLGLSRFCGDFKRTHTLDEIKEIKKKFPKIEIFISINKMIYDQDLDALSHILVELDKLNVTGVCFYDLAILQLKQELNLSLDLVWNQTHMVTNVKTCNYYYQNGVSYSNLSSEITLDEMIEIKNYTKMKCMTLLFGYPVVAQSKRKLLSNYYDFLKKDGKKELVITEPVSKQEYLVREDETATTFLYHRLLNGSKSYLSLLEIGFDYGILKEDDVDKNLFLAVLGNYSKIKDGNSVNHELWLRQMDDLIPSSYTGFFNQKTIFKVKKNEKN